jgi:hypothetical protein
MAICLLFGTVAVAGLGTVIPQTPPNRADPAPRGAGDGRLTTGSIIFVPILGNACRKKVIDNSTWQIRDGGHVDCRAALAQDADGNRSEWPASRINIIRAAFDKR